MNTSPQVVGQSLRAVALPARIRPGWPMMVAPVCFAVTMFLSAALLFSVQPMIGKMVLPLFGGTSAVWNACMVFFQASLLAGYSYAHASSTWLGRKRHMALHAGLSLLPLLVLPIAIDKDQLSSHVTNPVGRLLLLLLVVAALPVIVVSTTAPLLQRWLVWSGHRTARDPYFLYGASNLGSLLALLAYPFVIEPHVPLMTQSRLWSIGYLLFITLTAACGVLTYWLPTGAGLFAAPQSDPLETGQITAALTVGRRARWVALALVPSSLMLGTTSYITTDLTPIPLLWMVPLTIYLVSFIIVFSYFPGWLHRAAIRMAPPVILVVVYLMSPGTSAVWWQLWMTIVLHLLLLFVVAMVCHGELAKSRPSSSHLTEYYLWISLGGVLGGMFNTLLAPLLFNSVAEYPLAIVAACLLLPASTQPGRLGRWLDLGLPFFLGLLAISLTSGLLVLAINASPFARILHVEPSVISNLSERFFRFDADRVNVFLKYGTPVVLCYFFAERPIRFALGVGVVLLVSALWANMDSEVIFRERSFYGVLKVENQDTVHRLIHGTTLHGMQSRDPAQRFEPWTYYHRTGPIGQVFDALRTTPVLNHIAVVGLGAGTMASYGGPGRTMTFFEIDPVVVRIAQNSDYFTYLQDCRDRGGVCEVVIGDARLKLNEAADSSFGLIVVDAFSSDAIPIHLITLECVQTYLARLAPHGLIAFHISNRHVDLEPVLANIAQKAGLVSRAQKDGRDNSQGKAESHWVVLARQREDFGALAEDPRWEEPLCRPEIGVWTDDFSDPVKVFRWN